MAKLNDRSAFYAQAEMLMDKYWKENPKAEEDLLKWCGEYMDKTDLQKQIEPTQKMIETFAQGNFPSEQSYKDGFANFNYVCTQLMAVSQAYLALQQQIKEREGEIQSVRKYIYHDIDCPCALEDVSEELCNCERKDALALLAEPPK